MELPQNVVTGSLSIFDNITYFSTKAISAQCVEMWIYNL